VGGVCISIELESIIGAVHAFKYSSKDIESRKIVRRALPALLRVLEEFEIPCTWGVLGHLLLTECDGMHSDIPRPDPESAYWYPEDWFKEDPGTNFEDNIYWYTPDLIQEVVESSVKHELGTHGFSHYNYRRFPDNCLKADLAKAIEVMKSSLDIVPTAMTLPYNLEGYTTPRILSQNGIIAYRLWSYSDVSLPHEVLPGLWAMKSTLPILPESKPMIIKRCIDRAINKNSICNLWTHVSDWGRTNGDPMSDISRVLTPVLNYIAEKRDGNEIEVLTMTKWAKRMDRLSNIDLKHHFFRTPMRSFVSISKSKRLKNTLRLSLPDHIFPKHIKAGGIEEEYTVLEGIIERISSETGTDSRVVGSKTISFEVEDSPIEIEYVDLSTEQICSKHSISLSIKRDGTVLATHILTIDNNSDHSVDFLLEVPSWWSDFFCNDKQLIPIKHGKKKVLVLPQCICAGDSKGFKLNYAANPLYLLRNRYDFFLVNQSSLSYKDSSLPLAIDRRTGLIFYLGMKLGLLDLKVTRFLPKRGGKIRKRFERVGYVEAEGLELSIKLDEIAPFMSYCINPYFKIFESAKRED